MATPQVIGNDQSLATQCLVFIQSLVNQRIGFNFNLTSGDFTCSFDSTGTVIAALARIPTEVKKKSSSPSTKRSNAKRRQLFLESKKQGSSCVDYEKTAQNEPPQSACEEPPQAAHNEQPQTSALKEPTQPFSERLCFPSSSESADLDTTDYGGGHITKKIRMDKVPPLKVLVDAQSSPKYRIQQLDGNCSLSDLSLFDDNYQSEHGDNQPSEHDDDPKTGQSTNCPVCDQPLSIFHQCQDPNQQTNIDICHPVNGRSRKETMRDKILDIERKYLDNPPDGPEVYKSLISNLILKAKEINEMND